MSALFGFASAPVDVEIRLAGEDERKIVEVKGEKDRKEMCPVYFDGESVEGQVGIVGLNVTSVEEIRSFGFSNRHCR